MPESTWLRQEREAEHINDLTEERRNGELMCKEERCCFCQDLTGKAGEGEDSIYFLGGQIGPMCDDCCDQLSKELLEE